MIIFLYFFAYQLLTLLALPLIGIYLLLRKWRGKSVFGVFRERMGYVPKAPRDKKVVWIHAVSVGEVLAIQELIVRIKSNDAAIFVYLTTGTLAGNKIAREQLAADQVSFIPFDFLIPVLWAFSRIKPARLMLIEAELWPNLLMVAFFKRIPCYLLNARITLSSASRSTLRCWLVLPLLRIFKHIYAQTAQEQQAFVRLGVDARSVSDLGNIKAFNVQVKKQALRPDPSRRLAGSSGRAGLGVNFANRCKIDLHESARPEESVGRLEGSDSYPTLLVGSLHQPELAVYLDLFKDLKQIYPKLTLILAPRHFHWQHALIEAVQRLNVSYVLVDNPNVSVPEVLANHDIVLICTIGKLFELYPLADLFFLGGTFVPIGGHNLLEPAVWGNPMVVGPYHQNSQVIADELEKVGGLVKVLDPQKLNDVVRELLQNPEVLAAKGAQASTWLAQSAKHVEVHVDKFVREL